MGKTIGGVLGVLLGLAVSYLFKPVTIFYVPTFWEWFQFGMLDRSCATTIIICGVVGGVLGLLCGAFLDRQSPAKTT